ncbi:HhoA/HhoB/HtrA family serine endopeptidase [Merismopedia glauca]|uniref:Serine protease n=1 Tax=Merismopedia glauca CCAP 1448/3 TaxID=1296344 RepID=A0A2T1C3W4_9CYAN|nr:HhoA/HhoB/HtrA family serine endopeptidase [Merismopedia glauca]PSB02972.1 serine protease [Merismopedia glauca CCAP 1448/3]
MKILPQQFIVYLAFLSILSGCRANIFGELTPETPTKSETPPSTQASIPSPSPSQPLVNAPITPQNPNFIAIAVEKVGPAVVRIDASRTVSSGFSGLTKDKVEQGTGSGFIISSDGRLVTNAHVVSGADTVEVTLKDGRKYSGKVLGVDPVTDVAAVKITATNLPIVKYGNSDSLIPGQWAIAIGNPLGLDNTVTVGIVSATGRSSSQIGIADKRVNFIQTDAAINPGNSGGPLLNDKGEVIGINTAIRADAQGLGFAIPINTADKIANQLFTKGKADHAFLGIQMIALTPEIKKQINSSTDVKITLDRGVLIGRVVPSSPAAQAGLKPGDVIQKINTKTITTANDVQDIIEASQIGQELSLEINRNGQTQIVTVKPGPYPTSQLE